MLTEEALLMIVAFAAVGLVILGVLELLWPSRPRHPMRRRPALPEPRPAPAEPTPLAARRARSNRADSPRRKPGEPAAALAETPPGDLFSGAAPETRDAGGAPGPTPTEVAADVAVPIADAPVATPAAIEPAETVAAPAATESLGETASAPPAQLPETVPASESAPGDDPMIRELAKVSSEPVAVDESPAPADRCAALLEGGRFDDAIALAEATLQETASSADSQGDGTRARLWGLLGRARQARGDADGARTALESAIAAAPRLERGEWERHLIALAVATARSQLARSQGTTSEDAIGQVRGALAWLEAGLALAPGDRGLRDTLTAVRAALWPTYAKVAVALSQRGDFMSARRHLREALEDEALPTARRRSFADLLATTYSDEAGQLMAEAIRSMKDGRDADAMAALARAEDLLTLVPADGPTGARRQELERRLWWGYMKLGTRRLEQSAGEDALDALFRALALESVGVERLAETRGTLVRAFDALTEARRAEVERLLDRGERDAAAAEADRLAELLRSGTARGLAHDDLAEVLSRAQDVFGRLGRGA